MAGVEELSPATSSVSVRPPEDEIDDDEDEDVIPLLFVGSWKKIEWKWDFSSVLHCFICCVSSPA